MTNFSKTILIATAAAIIFGAGFLFALPAKAIDVSLVVEYSSDGGASWLPLSAAIFSETNFLPGQDVARLIRVTNNSGSTQRIAMEAINYAGFPNPDNVPGDDLSRALLIVIKQGATEIYGGAAGEKTFFDFYKNGETYLSDLDNGLNIQYDITISFPPGTGNEWQSKITTKTTQFDILVGFEGTEGGLPLPSPGGSAGGGGLPPGLTIVNDDIRILDLAQTSVTISWLTSYNSTSQVIYGAESDNHTLNLADNSGSPPKYGYEHTTPELNISPKITSHTVTITGLTAGTTYYFRAVSHGSLAISREYNFTTLAAPAVPAETPVAGVSAGPTGPTGSPAAAAGQGWVAGSSEEGRGRLAGLTGGVSISAGAPVSAATQEETNQLPKTEGAAASLAANESSGFFGNFFAAIGALGWKGWLTLLIIVLVILTLLFILRKRSKEKESRKQIL